MIQLRNVSPITVCHGITKDEPRATYLTGKALLKKQLNDLCEKLVSED